MSKLRIVNAAPDVIPVTAAEHIADSIFNEARYKVYRALRQAYEVSCAWKFTIENQSNEVGLKFNAAKGGHELFVALRPPLEVGLATGDCLRSLRSALDYLVSAMARSVGLDDSQTIFPFAPKRDDLMVSFRAEIPNGANGKRGRRAGALYAVSQKFPELQAVILDDVQPFSSEDGARSSGDLLRAIITSDNADKHRMIVPIIQHVDLDLSTSEDQSIKNCFIAGRPAMPPFVFEGPEEMKAEGVLAFDIIFPPTVPKIAGKPVISTLIQGCEMVTEVIGMFEAKFGNRT